jgi:hypothetical protein
MLFDLRRRRRGGFRRIDRIIALPGFGNPSGDASHIFGIPVFVVVGLLLGGDVHTDGGRSLDKSLVRPSLSAFSRTNAATLPLFFRMERMSSSFS